MLTLLTTAMLAAAPASGLTVSAELGKPTTPVDTFLDAIEQELLAVKLPVKRLALTCAGQRECLLEGARKAAVPALVAVSVAYSKKQVTLDLEGVRVVDGATVAQLTFPVSGKLTDADREGIRQFGARVVEAVTSPPLKTDTPVAVAKPALVPQALKPAEPAVVVTAAPRSRVPAYLLGGGAVASGVVSGVFLALASVDNGKLAATKDLELTRPAAEALVKQTNDEYTASLAAGLAAGALATAAIVWLVTE